MDVVVYESDPGDDLGWSANGLWTLRRAQFRAFRFGFDVRSATGQELADVDDWLVETMGQPCEQARWTVSTGFVFHFSSPSDAMLFKLRWF